MKKLKLLTLSFLLTSCSNSKLDGPRQVVDFPKEDDYYQKSECDEGHKKKSKKLVIIGPVKKPFETKPDRKISSISDLMAMAGSSQCPDLTNQEITDLKRTADLLDGSLDDPRDYSKSGAGLQNYINDVGVPSKFSAAEMISPHRPASARACGYSDGLLPPQCRWMSGAVQGLVAAKMREVINNGDVYGPKSITLRNWWRPTCYNEKVGGAGRSDHIQARGFDLDFPTPNDRAKAQKWLCELYKREKPFNMQVGIGCQTIHIGLGSPKNMKNSFGPDGSRFWTYGSLKSCSVKRLSGDDCWQVKGNQKRIHSDERDYRGGL
ncbi:MAG: hypothetical protein K9K67_13000 [Bacteriovoracaceae bacterium]|nr:hypothetical protein [Bacteriovoracaceae bacterium]